MNKLLCKYKLYIPFMLIGIVLLALLPTSCTCNCSSSDGIGGGWKPYDRIFFIREGDSNYEICEVNDNGSSLTVLAVDSSDYFQHSWSSDGTKIAYVSDDEQIYVMNADGSNKVKLTNTTDKNEMPSWSPDGSMIVFTGWAIISGDEDDSHILPDIYAVNADGSNQVNLTNQVNLFNQVNLAISSDELRGFRNPIWSPDGAKIAFMCSFSSDGPWGPCDLYTMNADGSNLTVLAADSMSYSRFSSSPDDSRGYSRYSWSPDGTKIAFYYKTGPRDSIYVINSDGNGQPGIINLPYWSSTEVSPLWSPDGSKLVFSASIGVDPDNWTAIHSVNADGTNLTNLSMSISGNNRNPSWNGAGDKIYFASNNIGNWDIYVVDIDGSNLTNITNSPEDETHPVWKR